MKSLMVAIVLIATLMSWAGPAGAQDPDVRVAVPLALSYSYQEARYVPPVLDLELVYTAGPDGAAVSEWRYAFIEAKTDLGRWVSTKYYYLIYGAEILGFDQPVWGEWQAWDDPDGVQDLHFEGLVGAPLGEDREYYFLALQVKDANGSTSTELDYAGSVHNFWVTDTKTPALSINGPEVSLTGVTSVVSEYPRDVESGQDLEYTWEANADDYASAVASYRWGWDIVDHDDPMDPGWAVASGLGAEHMSTGVFSLESGVHVLTIECRDTSDQLTRARLILTVVGPVANEGGLGGGDLLPAESRIVGNHPNPFNPSTELAFEMARPGVVKLSIVDARGRHVARLLSQAMSAGKHKATWMGLDDLGRSVPAGVYFGVMVTDDVRETKRMTLLK